MSALDRLKLDEPFDNFDDVLKFVERPHFEMARIPSLTFISGVSIYLL